MVVACARRGASAPSAAPSSRCRRSIMARSIAAAAARGRAKLRERCGPLSRLREVDGGLEGVAAGIALPQMAHEAVIDQFRPFRHEQALAALRAGDLRTVAWGLCGAAGVKIHGGILRFFVTAQVQIGRSRGPQGGEPAFGVLAQGLDDVPTLLFGGRYDREADGALACGSSGRRTV